MEPVDPKLLEAIHQGDENAFAEFIQQRHHQLLAYIERNLGPALRKKVETQDIYQEVSIDCIKALKDVDLSERDPFNWMCQMAQRRIVDAHRRFFGTQKRDAGREVSIGGAGNQTREAGLMNMLVASMTSPSQAFSRGQKEFRLQEAVAQLSPEQREALRLRYVEGKPTGEIAKELKKTDVAIRVMLTRAVKKLQDLIGED